MSNKFKLKRSQIYIIIAIAMFLIIPLLLNWFFNY